MQAVVPDDAFFGEVGYPPGGRLPLRVQRDIQLVMLHAGSCRIRVDGQTHDIPVDGVAMLLPGGRESFRFDRHRGSHHTWIAMQYEQVPEPLCRWLHRRMPTVMPIPPRLMPAFRAGATWRGQVGSTARRSRAHLAAAGLLSLIDAAGLSLDQSDHASDRVERWHPAVRRVHEFIQDRYAQPIDLDTLAEHAHVTPAHLIRLCREQLGETPIRRLWSVRTQRGLELLTASGLTVGEIADACGFRSAPHFARLVRQHTGHSPRAYRDRAWSRQPSPDPAPRPAADSR